MIAILTSVLALQPAQWPECDDPDLALGRGADCVLTTGDALGWFLGFDYKPDPEPNTVSVIVAGADGIPVQTLDLVFEADLGVGAPSLRDVDGDGFEDIVIRAAFPGVVNGDWAVLFGDFDGFWNVGLRPNGHSLVSAEPGLFFTLARASASQRAGYFYTRDGASLTEVAVIALDANEDDQFDCRLERAIDDRGEEFYCNAAQST